MIDWTPSAIAIQIGPLPLYWYGIAYALGLLAVYMVVVRLAVRTVARTARPRHARGMSGPVAAEDARPDETAGGGP